jgi:hypothetical protein
MAQEETELLTIKEAAQEAQVTEQAIRNAIYRGKLTTTEKYGRILIERDVFNRYRAETKMGRPTKRPSDNENPST